MSILGVGIIGCGNISASYLSLAPLFNFIDVRAVSDLNMDAARARAEAYNVRAETIESLLTADNIDIIVNLTVPSAHFEVTRQILHNGKHAYSEKPYVLSLEDGEALRSIAAQKQLRVGSAPDTFLGGSHQLARAVIDEGKIGKVVGGTCHIMSHGMERWHPNPDFFFKPGGGPLLDMGPYYITNLVQLIGPVKAVTAMAGSAFDVRTIENGPREGEKISVETPTTVHAVLQFANGAIVTLGASWDVWAHRHANMELYGTDASLYIPDPNFFGGDVELADADGSTQVLAGRDHPFSVPNAGNSTDPQRANYRCAGLADMAAGILEGRPHRCSLELATHVVDVMTAILAAADAKCTVELTTTCERPAPLNSNDALKLLKAANT
ncbi:MAG: Gfo/Idh/MocA family oxidoreductase [Pseudomonadota bacterium]